MNTGNWCIYSNAILQIHFSAICKELQQAVNINLPQCKSYCCETYMMVTFFCDKLLWIPGSSGIF